MTSGVAMLKYLEEHAGDVYPALEAAGTRVRDGIEQAFARKGIAAKCTGVASLFMTHFPKVDLKDRGAWSMNNAHALCVDCDLEKREKELRIRLLNKGVYVMHGGGAISTAHSREDLRIFLEKREDESLEVTAYWGDEVPIVENIVGC